MTDQDLTQIGICFIRILQYPLRLILHSLESIWVTEFWMSLLKLSELVVVCNKL